jgi:hypothetical protein
MKPTLLSSLLVSLLIVPVFLNYGFIASTHAETTPDVYVGIHLEYGGVADAKALIDRVSSCTNFFAVGTGEISSEEDVNSICQYLYDKGMSFITLSGRPMVGFDPDFTFEQWLEYQAQKDIEWTEQAKAKWGNRFLGVYVGDEPAGKQLDGYNHWISDANSYSEAESQWEATTRKGWDGSVGLFGGRSPYYSQSYRRFAADYALYWFDYKAGFDVVLGEFVWNYSRQLNIAQCRGAAVIQNKDWGVIIDWKYDRAPYIESGEELYDDLVLAYDSGAKYIVIFDGNEDWAKGILDDEHLQALQRFWQYTQNNPRKTISIGDRVAFVLPKDYGYSFRLPNDKIWGVWEADALAHNLNLSVSKLLGYYGDKLDIIYDDGLQAGNNYGYSKLIYWNSYSPQPPAVSMLSPENNKTYTENNVPLNFTVDKQAVWIGYSLDGQENVTITGNTTLSGLSSGLHNVTVYAKDEFENAGVSETIFFSISEPFPTALVITASVASVAVVAVGVWVYFKKHKR